MTPASSQRSRIRSVMSRRRGASRHPESLTRFLTSSGAPQDRQVVLYCKSGVRSAEALAVTKGAGFADAVHVGGGVLAWVNQVDPSLPTY